MSDRSFFQKSDSLTQVLSELAQKGYLSQDIFDTMRFGHLAPDEKFINVYCFTVARSFLYAGIGQWERMADALGKWKKERDPLTKPEDKPSSKPENDNIRGFLESNYNPVVVDEIIERWREYDQDKDPHDPKNVTWVLNHGWRFNRSLMHWAHYFDPAHVSALNSSFGVNGRTFTELGLTLRSLGKREFEIASPSQEKKEGWHLQKPVSRS